jgi:hypothetical protein
MSKFNSVVVNISQDFNADEKRTARQNIDAAAISSAFDASGNLVASGDITFDPDKIYVGGTEVLGLVQSDWNESDSASLAYISNKPTIPAGQVQSDWAAVNSADMSYIKNKPEVPSIWADYGIITTDEVRYINVDMMASKEVTFTNPQGAQSSPGFFVPHFDEDDEGKKLVAGPDGYPVCQNDSDVDWVTRFSSTDGSELSTYKISTHSIDGSGDSTDIWGTATIRFNTSGSYALCPADVTTELTEPDQCLNLKNISEGIHSFNFCFKAQNPGDIRYLEIKGQAGKTASDVDLLYLATQNKRSV